MRHYLLSATLLALGLSAAVYAGGEFSLSSRAYAVDGDTIHDGTLKVRLASIDAPERRQLCLDDDEDAWACGDSARRRLADMLASAPVTCRQSGSDRYGRMIATCMAHPRGQAPYDIGARLVLEGLAVAYWDDRYLSEQDQASSKKAGVWAGYFLAPADWRVVCDGAQNVPVDRDAAPVC